MPAKTTLPRVNLFSLDLLYTVCPDWENTIVKGHWQLARQVHRWHTAPALFDHPGGTFPASVANLCKVRVSQHKWFLKDESNRASFGILSFDDHFTRLCVPRRDVINTVFRVLHRNWLCMRKMTYANTICSAFVLIWWKQLLPITVFWNLLSHNSLPFILTCSNTWYGIDW